MKGLMVSELIMVKKSGLIMLLFAIIYGLMAVVEGEPYMFLILPLVYSAMSIGNMNQGELSKWNKYSIILPIERKTIVNTRYLIALLTDAASIILILIGYFTSAALGNLEISSESLTFTLIGAVVMGLIMPIIMIPVVLRFSLNAAVYVGLGLGALTGGFIAVMSDVVTDKSYEKWLQVIFDLKNIIPYAILAAVLIFFAISRAISLKVYNRKDI